MTAARDVVERYLAADLPAYGLTTGLGERVVEGVPPTCAPTSRGSPFSSAPTRSAHPWGRMSCAPRSCCARTVWLVGIRRETGGRAGSCHSSSTTSPVIPSISSIGTADICLLAHVGRVLMGDGEAEFEGEVLPGGQALEAAGLRPLELAPKDGLATISSNAVSAAQATLALADTRRTLDAAQAAAALSFEGFRANLSPLDERVVAARPAPGQASCARQLRELLAGGSLSASGGRRVQDPLSFRCVSQVHGSLATALEVLAAARARTERRGDNPLVLVEDGEILHRELPRGRARTGRRRRRARPRAVASLTASA
jgi:histidine ammonia-lyase